MIGRFLFLKILAYIHMCLLNTSGCVSLRFGWPVFLAFHLLSLCILCCYAVFYHTFITHLFQV